MQIIYVRDLSSIATVRIILLTTEVVRNFLSRQCVESSDGEKRHSGDNSTFYIDRNHFSLMPYGCGICGEMFEIEEEFVLHCSYHNSDDPEKETFLELFNPFISRPYGCGKCGEMFVIAEKFIEHCYDHYYDDPKKDIFL